MNRGLHRDKTQYSSDDMQAIATICHASAQTPNPLCAMQIARTPDITVAPTFAPVSLRKLSSLVNKADCV
jgi:hypothetical protein